MNLRTTNAMAAVAMAVVVGWASVAAGQVNPDRVDPTVAPGPTAAGARAKPTGKQGMQTSLSLGGSYTFASNLEDGRGDYSVTRAGSDTSLLYPTSENFALLLEISQEWSWYDFDPSSQGITQGIGKPLSQVVTTRVSPGINYRIDDRWGVLLGASIESTGETDADFSDTLNYGAIVAASYKVNDNFSLSFGAAAQSRLEDDVQVIPIVGFDWRITEKWRAGVRGPGAQLTYSPSESWDFTLQGSFESREYRLADDSPIPEGVLRDRRVVVGLQAQWTPRPWLTLRAEGGVVVWSELEFDDRNGDGLDTLDADPTGYVGLSGTVRF